MSRTPLPRSFADTAFSVAHARAAGIPSSRLRAANLETPFRGVRAAPGMLTSDTLEGAITARALVFAVRMTPHTFFSHVTAAVLWHTELPVAALDTTLLDVAVFAPRRNPRGKGIRGRVLDPERVSVRIHPEHGVPVTSPASTWATLASVLVHPYDLVAAADSLVRIPQHPSDPPAPSTVEQLDAATQAGRRVGVARLREALPRVRVGSASRPETWTRLTLVDAGLPEPALACNVFSSAGVFIGRVDLAYPHWKIAIEYEGDQHRTDPEQWNIDILRYERLTAEGWHVIRVTKAELFQRPGAVVARVRAAIAAASR